MYSNENKPNDTRKRPFWKKFVPPVVGDIFPMAMDDVVKELLKVNKKGDFWIACQPSGTNDGLVHIYRTTPYKIVCEDKRHVENLINVRSREHHSIEEAIRRMTSGCDPLMVIKPEEGK